jgi:hypothetical protein
MMLITVRMIITITNALMKLRTKAWVMAGLAVGILIRDI